MARAAKSAQDPGKIAREGVFSNQLKDRNQPASQPSSFLLLQCATNFAFLLYATNSLFIRLIFYSQEP